MFEKDTSINKSFSCLDDGDIDDFCLILMLLKNQN